MEARTRSTEETGQDSKYDNPGDAVYTEEGKYDNGTADSAYDCEIENAILVCEYVRKDSPEHR
jgi:hypothetical protein